MLHRRPGFSTSRLSLAATTLVASQIVAGVGCGRPPTPATAGPPAAGEVTVTTLTCPHE